MPAGSRMGNRIMEVSSGCRGLKGSNIQQRRCTHESLCSWGNWGNKFDPTAAQQSGDASIETLIPACAWQINRYGCMVIVRRVDHCD